MFSLLLSHVHSHWSSLWEASTPIPFVDILGAHFGHSYEPDPEPWQQLCRLRSSYFGWLMVRSCASETLVSLLHSELLKIFKYCIVVRSVVRWKRKSCATCHVCLPYLQFWLWSITASKSWRHEMWVPESQLKPGKPCIQQPHFSQASGDNSRPSHASHDQLQPRAASNICVIWNPLRPNSPIWSMPSNTAKNL